MLDVITVAAKYNCRPSEIIADLDTYTAFCFDEACSYILSCIQGNGKKDSKKIKLYFDEDLVKVKEQSGNMMASLFDALEANDKGE